MEKRPSDRNSPGDRQRRDPRTGGGGNPPLPPREPHAARDGNRRREPGRPDRSQGGGSGTPRERPTPPSAGAPAEAPVTKPAPPRGPMLNGWLPDFVYTGEKFESGLAFFADALGRITRFSREPADLAGARRLAGQAALPGMVNAHSHAFHRVLRGRTEQRPRPDRDTAVMWREAHDRALQRLTAEDVFDTARMAFLEMLLGGITCVGEFHYLHHQADGTPAEDPNLLSREVLRAAHDAGVRIALLKVAHARGDFGGGSESAPVRSRTPSADQFVRECEALRRFIAAEFPPDEAWLGVAAQSLGAVPLQMFKAIGTYAHAQRLRLHAHVSTLAAENAACVAEYGRTPVALLAEHGLIDKRFTAVDAIHLSGEEIKLLGTARASVCVCPLSEQSFGLGTAAVEELSAAGAGIALGTDRQVQIDLLENARLLEYGLRAKGPSRGAGADPADAWWHAATVAGARSLGAMTGALEVGRPADFFTVNLFDPSMAGAAPESLLANIVFGLERRAIREVWVGARPIITGGRHAFQGPIIGRFADLQKRLWGPVAS